METYSQEQSSFFRKLPREIRDRIYGYAMFIEPAWVCEEYEVRRSLQLRPQEEETPVDQTLDAQPDVLPGRRSLLHVCRRAYDESYEIFKSETLAVVVASNMGVFRTRYFGQHGLTVPPAFVHLYVMSRDQHTLDSSLPHAATRSDWHQTLAVLARGVGRQVGVRITPAISHMLLVITLHTPKTFLILKTLVQAISAGNDIHITNLKVLILIDPTNLISLAYCSLLKRALRLMHCLGSCTVEFYSMDNDDKNSRRVDAKLFENLKKVLEKAAMTKPPREDNAGVVATRIFKWARATLKRLADLPNDDPEQSRYFDVDLSEQLMHASRADRFFNHTFGCLNPSRSTAHRKMLNRRLNEFDVIKRAYHHMREELIADGFDADADGNLAEADIDLDHSLAHQIDAYYNADIDRIAGYTDGYEPSESSFGSESEDELEEDDDDEDEDNDDENDDNEDDDNEHDNDNTE